MRAITIDMVGSALKKPAQTRVRNPAKKMPRTLYNGVAPMRYVVEKASTATAKWSPLASFGGKADAVEWAKDYAKQNRTILVRVIDRDE